nr:polyprotein [Rhizoctonia solani hypovirus 9]
MSVPFGEFSQVFWDAYNSFRTEDDYNIRVNSALLWLERNPILQSQPLLSVALLTIAEGQPVIDRDCRRFLRRLRFREVEAGDLRRLIRVVEGILDEDHVVGLADMGMLIALGEARFDGSWDEMTRDWHNSGATPICNLMVYCLHNRSAFEVTEGPWWLADLIEDFEFYWETTYRFMHVGAPEDTQLHPGFNMHGARIQFRRIFARAAMANDLAHAVRSEAVDRNDITFAAYVVAEAVEDLHLDYDACMMAACMDLAQASSEPVNPNLVPVGGEGMQRAMDSYLQTRGLALTAVNKIEEFISVVREWVEDNASFVFAPFLWVQDVVTRLGAELGKFIYALTGVVLEVFEYSNPADDTSRAFWGVVLFGLADLVDQRHRRNPKSVWAMLSTRKGARLTRADMWMNQLSTFSYQPSETYQNLAKDLIQRMENAGVDTSILTVEPPSRQVRFPQNTFGPASHNDLPLPHNVHFLESEREKRQVAQTLALGAPQGIDGAWFASNVSLQASIDRYVVDRPTIDMDAKLLIKNAADQLFDDYPELYDRPEPMSVKSVMAALEWKYSAGLPFLPAIRTRQEIKATRWYQALAQAVESIIEAQPLIGPAPFKGIAFHAFPKTDVVPLAKVNNDVSALRSVTAEWRASAIMINTLLFSRNKRIPPREALVLNTIPRREGALQEVYDQLTALDHLVAADGWRFDSQVPPEIVSLGSTRLYERGVAGWWGAKAATSLVTAYYEALATGLIVNLMDGTVTRKTGGGGTGSASTSTDNRDWTRLILMAGWCLAFDRPMAEFKQHVTLGNASDDILMGVDNYTREGLHEWQTKIWEKFGLRFDFELMDDTGELLHLRFVPEGMLDFEAYAKLGMSVPQFPLMHDPKRLALKRSDYRSDRMSLNYMKAADHVATRAFGHLYLCAHNPDGFHDVLQEGIEAAAEYLSNYVERVEWDLGYSKAGKLVSADPRVTFEPSNALRKMAARHKHVPGTTSYELFLRRGIAHARLWLKQHRFPSYEHVFALWVTPQDWDAVRPMQKKWLKYALNPHYDIPIADNIQAFLLRSATYTSQVPVGLTRWSGMDVPVVSRPIVTQGFFVEHFIYRKFLQNHGVIPTFGEFAAKCRESPYSSITAPNEFWIQLADSAWAYNLRNEEKYPMHMLTGRMLGLTIIYGGIDWLNNVFRMSRVLGFLFAIFFFLVRDLDKWYSIIHLFYWLANGEASVAISNMSPRDPFIGQKVLAMLLQTFIPLALYRAWFGADIVASCLGRVGEIVYKGVRITTHSATRINRMLADPGTRWTELANALANPIPGMAPRKIIAGVGSGKSTSLVRAILELGVYDQVLLLVPTLAIVRNYTNDYLDSDQVVLVDDMTVWSSAQLHVATYHRGMGLLIQGTPMRRLVVLFDEAHSNSTAMAVCFLRFHRATRIMMTGTPRGEQWEKYDAPTYTLGRNSQFVRHQHVYRSDPPPVVRPDGDYSVTDSHIAWFAEFLSAHRAHPSINGGRFAVYHPDVRTCATLARVLYASGFQASITSANTPHIRDEGAVVGTWAIVTGVNFQPPIDAIVDCGVVARPSAAYNDLDGLDRHAGTDFVDRPNVLRLVASDPDSAEQVGGRTARVKDGVVWRSPLSGTGTPPPYVADVLVHLSHDSQALRDLTGVYPAIIRSTTGAASLLSWMDVAPHTTIPMDDLVIAMVTLLLACSVNGVHTAVRYMQDPLNAPLEAQATIRRLLLDPGVALAGLAWPPRTVFNLRDYVRQVGFATYIGSRKRIWYGRPLVHYKKTIAPCGIYSSMADGI